MDYRQLRYFVAVAQAGSISAAARALFVTQPTLTVAIRKLEKSLDVDLLDRSTTPLSLTPAGKYLAEQGRAMLVALDSLTDQVRQLGAASSKRIRVGLTVLFAIHYMPKIAAFMTANPAVEVTLIHSGSREMQRQIATGTLDLGIVSFPCYEPALEILPLTDPHGFYDVAVAMRCDNPLAERESVTIAELAARVFSSLSENYVLGELLPELAHKAGFTPDIRFINDSWNALLASVVELDSVCLLPKQLESISAIPGVAWADLDDEFSRLPIGIATLKGQPRTPVIADLISRLLNP